MDPKLIETPYPLQAHLGFYITDWSEGYARFELPIVEFLGNRFGIGGSGRFSPNGDGRYDTFMPRGVASLELPFVFRIEDAEGQLVHRTTLAAAWDGQLPDGSAARSGQVYTWTVVIQEKEGQSYFSDEVLVE